MNSEIPKEDRPVITVDGPAASGKSTIAKLLAKKLGFAHLNSGLLYRSVAYLSIVGGLPIDNGEVLKNAILMHSISLAYDSDQGARLLLEGKDITESLATQEVSSLTSKASLLPEVRAALLEPQRRAFPGWGVVAEGRDMGTVVFPDSPLKFFVQADLHVRALRRMLQQFGDLTKISEGEVKGIVSQIEREIGERDKRDTERALSPTKPAEEAVLVDNTSRPLTAIVQSMYDECLLRGLVKGGSPRQ